MRQEQPSVAKIAHRLKRKKESDAAFARLTSRRRAFPRSSAQSTLAETHSESDFGPTPRKPRNTQAGSERHTLGNCPLHNFGVGMVEIRASVGLRVLPPPRRARVGAEFFLRSGSLRGSGESFAALPRKQLLLLHEIFLGEDAFLAQLFRLVDPCHVGRIAKQHARRAHVGGLEEEWTSAQKRGGVRDGVFCVDHSVWERCLWRGGLRAML